jgi:nucleoside-diphosphate-sugar epimerase
MAISRVLVTGGGGFVGSALVPRMLDAGYEVTVLDQFVFGVELAAHRRLSVMRGDIRDQDLVRSAVKGQDAVIHLACVANEPALDLDPPVGRSINLSAFTPLLLACSAAGVKRFINASSSSVYGVKPDGVEVTEDLPLEPLTGYARFKATREEDLRNWAGIYPQVTTVTVRPAALCGYAPRLRLDLVVNMFVAQALSYGKITVWGGEQSRALLHVEDMARCYEVLLSASSDVVDGKVWNVGCDNLSVMEIARLVGQATGADIDVQPMPGDDRRSYSICAKAIERDLGFRPRYSVTDAIQDLVTAFRLAACRIPFPVTPTMCMRFFPCAAAFGTRCRFGLRSNRASH